MHGHMFNRTNIYNIDINCIAVVAAESAIGLAILVAYYRVNGWYYGWYIETRLMHTLFTPFADRVLWLHV